MKSVKICSAVDEKKRVRKREALFQSKDNRRFRAPHSNRPRCSKLHVNGRVLSDKADLVQAWGDHFSTLAKSRRQSHEELSTLQSKVDDLTTAPLSNEEYILDVAFTLEEVQGAVNKLKLGKSGGPDGIIAEHLRWGGETLLLWLLGVLTPLWSSKRYPPCSNLA